MERIMIDFRNCKNAIDMHSELKEKFGFPNYYGENLSALWDCIGWFGRYGTYPQMVLQKTELKKL